MAKSKKNVGATVHKRGVTFRVWAPFADSVLLKYGSPINWQTAELKDEGDGYWFADVSDAEIGQEYKFSIKNGDQTLDRNDPRSLQLTATLGSSVIVDKSFDWGEDNFKLPNPDKLVLYELHVGSFYRPDASTDGTFDDVIEKLDYLKSLGINAIELMPIASMRDDHGWGYAPEFIYAVESAYGGRHALLKFIKEAHSRNIGVILDVVYNHFGPDEDLELWRYDGWYENDGGGIYFYNDWRAYTPWSDDTNFPNTRPDFGRKEVRDFILDNVRYWLEECRLDGLRVDSTIFMRNVYGRNNEPSTDLPEAWQLMQSINSTGKKINPRSLIIGEDVGANDYITKPMSEDGAGFDSQWQVTMPGAFRDALCPDNLPDINLSSILGELTRRYNSDAFEQIIYVDSHDSAANGGARLNELVEPGQPQSPESLSKLLLASGLLMTAPGIPMMFMGQEFAQGGSFDDWSHLDWHLADKYLGIVEAHKHLISLRLNRHGHTAGLSGQGMNISHVDDNNKVIAFHRWDKGGPGDDVFVVANFADKHHQEYVLGLPRNGGWKVRFNSNWKGYCPQFKNVAAPDLTVDSGQGTMVLPPRSVLILSQDK